MADKLKLTKDGVAKLEQERRFLIDVAREEVKVQLHEARAQGDLSENADYDAARNKQAEIEARIQEIDAILNNYELISDKVKTTKKVGLGTTVTVKLVETGKECSYMIVGTVESDPKNGKISNACPVGQALMGKVVGDVVEIKASKTYKMEILKIEIK